MKRRHQGTLRRLSEYLLRYKGLLALALLLTIGSNLLALIGPMLSGAAIDAMAQGPGGVDFDRVFLYAGLMLGFYLGSSILSYLLSRLMIYVSQKIVFTLRQDIFQKLTRLPVRFFDSHPTGDILSRISYDTDTISASLSNDVIQVLASVITIAGSLGMMLALSPALTLVFAVTVPLSMVLTRLISKHTRPLFSARSRKLGELNGFVEEMISGQKTLKAYNREEKTLGDLDRVNREVVDAYYKSEYYGSMMGPSVNFINNLSLTLISVFGSMMYMAGGITLGDISSFVLYSRKFSGPINEIANIFGELQSALAAADRVFRLLDEEEEPADAPGAEALRHVRGKVELKNVSFGYVPERVVLHDLDLYAPPGSLTAIVGPTGAGKTTLINLLMRFYDLGSGALLMDGKNVERLTRASVRLSYSMVLQDSWLFYGTVYDNLRYGRPEATREEVEAAAKAAHIHEHIMRLPQGYDTVLTDGAANISKGQKQLMTIARAMVMNARMLILDEATSNVDTRTERQLQAAMRALMKDKTCFVVAHRLSTIQNADRILVVRDGNVIEAGTHQELMDRHGFYRELFEAQFR